MKHPILILQPSPRYTGFVGTWFLIPSSCVYEQGKAPSQGTYVIAEREDGHLVFTIDWIDAEGAQHHVTFSGLPNGEANKLEVGDLADAFSISAPTARRLDTIAYKNGEALMFAERQLDESGAAMRVVQQVRLPDGTRPTNISVYVKQARGN